NVVPFLVAHAAVEGAAQAGDEVLNDPFTALRVRLHLAKDIAQKDALVFALDALLVVLEFFVGMKLLELDENFVAHLAVQKLLVAGDLQAGHHAVEGRVPDVAFGGRHLGAAKSTTSPPTMIQ